MKYSAILVDPPWQYRVFDDSDAAHGAAKSHYPTMTLEQIKSLPVSNLAAENCILFLWVTPPCLEEGLEVIRAWGFRYKTKAFNWVKVYPGGKLVLGLGHYTRANSEDCLLAVKGRPKISNRDVSQIIWENVPETIVAPVREHSRKPDEQYSRIERLTGGPYLELFARQRWPEWDVWGNQVESDIEMEAIAYGRPQKESA
ncbi:site-specific DNA-methyltransferase (adenine-specific) [Hydrogenispora ethanolica]|jgi:N6-adenosine-specific RNA methylase IME4|uniref:Site-specific DNA-methyltransferase (Adenine-specific) n=1 Tax=Hydrogenispora ethanolica TaxID=1082276 RepID=A0A4R1S5Z2_HYDET|nr:MT-A70 family methyltransferase [Hydrogenispora ethanolica]TCL74200.1 site-specific DNA-methyltransferase (adenine-specific) [Hydrogenispora ethanolica]